MHTLCQKVPIVSISFIHTGGGPQCFYRVYADGWISGINGYYRQVLPKEGIINPESMEVVREYDEKGLSTASFFNLLYLLNQFDSQKAGNVDYLFFSACKMTIEYNGLIFETYLPDDENVEFMNLFTWVLKETPVTFDVYLDGF